MRKSNLKRNTLLGIPAVIVLAVVLYQIPAIHARLSWRVEDLQAKIKYALNPPDEAIFVPEEVPVNTPVSSATNVPPTATPEGPTATAAPTIPPTAAPTSLPDFVSLDGVVYVDQHGRWNYCGPANLTMALKFWDWPGNRDDIARVIKPGIQDPSLEFIQQGRSDKNVMPYEMANFVIDETDFNVVVRYGGDNELLRRMIASGFPVLIEKGYYEADYTGKVAWLGHYLFVTGYDLAADEFIVQDAYLKPGENLRVSGEEMIDGWRSFNYLFMLIYPPDREGELFEALGPYLDPAWSSLRALELSEVEIETQEGINEFFAWFNKGTSHVKLQQYVDAAAAYDNAFTLYARLGTGDSERPYRIMWYQTGPYWAYYYSARYLDVINLANTTLYDTISEPTLEESFYWRGQAYLAAGENGRAVDDFREAVRLNPYFGAALNALAQLGLGP
ncbi:MAG: tetratricopeptide repeat protein [Verrucomicrobiota bacterium]